MAFERIVVGVDGSPEGAEALRQAVRLLSPGGRLVAVSAFDTAVAAPSGLGSAVLLDAGRAEAARHEAAQLLGGVANGVVCAVEGAAVDVLLETVREEDAQLVVVGSHGLSRLAGILLGSVATAVVRGAPCPVLVARAAATADGPVVVGVDGSEPADAARRVAETVAARLGVPCRVIAATGGKPLSLERLRRVEELEWSERDPVNALVEASRGASVVVVGCRGLHGFAALGSVSERVAHRAACSVLVLRPVPARAVLTGEADAQAA